MGATILVTFVQLSWAKLFIGSTSEAMKENPTQKVGITSLEHHSL